MGRKFKSETEKIRDKYVNIMNDAKERHFARVNEDYLFKQLDKNLDKFIDYEFDVRNMEDVLLKTRMCPLDENDVCACMITPPHPLAGTNKDLMSGSTFTNSHSENNLNSEPQKRTKNIEIRSLLSSVDIYVIKNGEINGNSISNLYKEYEDIINKLISINENSPINYRFNLNCDKKILETTGYAWHRNEENYMSNVNPVLVFFKNYTQIETINIIKWKWLRNISKDMVLWEFNDVADYIKSLVPQKELVKRIEIDFDTFLKNYDISFEEYKNDRQGNI